MGDGVEWWYEGRVESLEEEGVRMVGMEEGGGVGLGGIGGGGEL